MTYKYCGKALPPPNEGKLCGELKIAKEGDCEERWLCLDCSLKKIFDEVENER